MTTMTTSTKPTYEELEAEVKRLQETTMPTWEIAYSSRMLNVARNALQVITRVDYGEQAVSKAKDALEKIMAIEKEWNADYKTRNS